MSEENIIAAKVVNSANEIHCTIGPRLLESTNSLLMAHELRRRGLTVQREVPVDVSYKDLILENVYRIDLLIDQLVIVELKSVETVLPVHKKQLLTYLKLTNLRLGLLINFNEPIIKSGITRIVNNLT